jgi:hypothetical protein
MLWKYDVEERLHLGVKKKVKLSVAGCGGL